MTITHKEELMIKAEVAEMSYGENINSFLQYNQRAIELERQSEKLRDFGATCFNRAQEHYKKLTNALLALKEQGEVVAPVWRCPECYWVGELGEEAFPALGTSNGVFCPNEYCGAELDAAL